MAFSAHSAKLGRAVAAPELAPPREVTGLCPNGDALFAAIDIVEPSPRFRTDARDHDDSDVYVCRRTGGRAAGLADGEASAVEREIDAALANAAARAAQVTLFVYGWENVEPGELSWAFPSLRAALDAVKTMRNAVGWCIVGGADWPNVEAARATGHVLIEQA